MYTAYPLQQHPAVYPPVQRHWQPLRILEAAAYILDIRYPEQKDIIDYVTVARQQFIM